MYKRVAELAQACNDKVVAWRRKIHSYPELSNNEEKTAHLVADALKSMGIEVRCGVGGHGVVGLLKGARPGKTVALRADMDALPMKEETGLPYASTVDGVMHACGHDTHTAMLLGAASVLSEMRGEIEGAVKFIFQPAEEMNPVGGAPGMIRDGALEDPHVDALFALHVWPSHETGTIASKSGALMGASDRIFLNVTGSTAHGSEPQNGIDAIVIASHVVCGLQTIVSRTIAPLDSAVITLGTVKGGFRSNVIADLVEYEGTVRTVKPEIQDRMPGLIERTAQGIARSMGGDASLKYVRGYPSLINSKDLFDRTAEMVGTVFGEESFVTLETPVLGGEDFSFFAKERPGLMAFLGCRPVGMPPEDMAVLHNTKFNPDEACFPVGVRFYASSALMFLSAKQHI